MQVMFDDRQFIKDLTNIVEYSTGYLDGIKLGKKNFLREVGIGVKERLESFIDSSARVNPQALHHVYEWYQAGSPEARLFDIKFTTSNLGLSMKSSFRQSTSLRDGSSVPFMDKAMMMENGVSVTVRPKKSEVLVFENEAGTVFSKSPITIDNPGGPEVQGAYQAAFDSFFRVFFSQSFLMSSGMAQYLSNPMLYKQNYKAAKTGGKSLGVETGMRWIMNAGVLV
jgi:hypothetical protein